MPEQVKTKQIAANRQARHEYFVMESLERGTSSWWAPR